MEKSKGKNLGFAAVAKLAGVSSGTVSNAINRPEKVAAKTRERIFAAIEELEFVPNRAASALRLGNSKLIGLVIPEITNPFYSAIASGVTEAAAARGYTVALCVTHDDPDRELSYFDMLAEQRVAGVLVVPLTADTNRLRRLRMIDARLVLIDRISAADEGCSVAVDDEAGGRIALDHLIASGATRLVMVNGGLDIPQCANRSRGAHEASATCGLSSSFEEITIAEMTVNAGIRVGTQLATHPPQGVFCTNDQLAIGVIHALTDAGLRVPEDVAVVGYGDLELASESRVPLTTVEQPKELVGHAAVESMIAEITDDSAEHVHVAAVFSPRLVVRRSSPAA